MASETRPTDTVLTEDHTHTLGARIRGGILTTDNEGSDEARTVRNGMIDKRAVLIAQCTGTADVVAAIDFARENDISGFFEHLGELGETTPSVL